jgi:hypothetical protein
MEVLCFNIDRNCQGYPLPVVELKLGSNSRDDPEVRGGIWQEAESFIGKVRKKEKRENPPAAQPQIFTGVMILEGLA